MFYPIFLYRPELSGRKVGLSVRKILIVVVLVVCCFVVFGAQVSATSFTSAAPYTCSANCTGWGYIQHNLGDIYSQTGKLPSGCGRFSTWPTINDPEAHPWQFNIRCDDFNSGSQSHNNDMIEVGAIANNSHFCGFGIHFYWDTQVFNPATNTTQFAINCLSTSGHLPHAYDSLEFIVQPHGYNPSQNHVFDVEIKDDTTGYTYCNFSACEEVTANWFNGIWTENSYREWVGSWSLSDYLSASQGRMNWVDTNGTYYLETPIYPDNAQVIGNNPPTAGLLSGTNSVYVCSYIPGCNYYSK